MAFWQENNLQPKRSYRFTLSVKGETTGISEFLVEKVSKPSFSVGESEVKYLNHTFWYPGRVTWNDINFTIIDCLVPADANGTAEVMRMLEKSGYNIPERGDLKTVSKASSLAALGQIKIHQYSSEGGAPMETWVLNNAWIKDVKFGDLDYGSEDMQKIDITLKYDNAYIQVLDKTGTKVNLPTGAKS
tara:strand:+ start:298 stop:861 length:564 start_codon:yes stop_codon:yes gene_type:complete